MAIIQSGASADLATVDPVSKAIRITPYDSTGVEIEHVHVGEYNLSVNIPTFTAALAAGSAVFTIRNGGVRKMRILALELNPSFGATTAVASVMQFSVRRFTAATPTGGTTLTTNIVPEDSVMTTSQILDARCATAGAAVTTTGVAIGSPIFLCSQPRTNNAGATNFEMNRDLILNLNEGLLIYYDLVGVIGDTLGITIYWGEF